VAIHTVTHIMSKELTNYLVARSKQKGMFSMTVDQEVLNTIGCLSRSPNKDDRGTTGQQRELKKTDSPPQ